MQMMEEEEEEEKEQGVCNGEGGLISVVSAEIKKGLHSVVSHSGPHPLRRNDDKDDMTSLEASEAPAQELSGS